jgi:Transposase, Mutator family
MCSWTPPTARPASTGESLPRPSSWRLGCVATAAARCSALRWVTLKTARLDGILTQLEGARAGRVQLVIADAHLGLRRAVRATMAGAAVQRCRVHFLRNVLASVPKALLRLARAVLVEAHDEWQVSDRRYLSEGSMALLTQATEEVTPAQLLPA